ncbi:hypothetical protein CYMTET_8090 [Cymbomonas tetramitiformis]|uniref:Uncharacterized protein n=1 Tax=Cymbomonas tetramitiformis TaxID=36881 RepID=A0AAE0LGU2_9CHLO|nr:hypothetical protein CYMTET_8090 [Cymbomonas tetramitiformis]
MGGGRVSTSQVVAAIGDSITAGFAIEGLPVENKGESWAVGGGVGHVTLPNILKHYSPNITGASTGTHPMYTTAGFNMAISGNNVSRLMAQSKKLVAALESSAQVNMKEDWKVLTVFIGINDLRIGCQSKPDPLWTHEADFYEKQLAAVFTFLRASIPRVFVNLVGLLHLSSITTASGIAEHCQVQHYATEIECPCCFHNASYMREVRGEFNARMQKIAAAWASRDLHDFAVVWQPMMTDYSIPDWTYMSRFDCFHYSKAWHADAAEDVALKICNTVQSHLGTASLNPLDSHTMRTISLLCPEISMVLRSFGSQR